MVQAKLSLFAGLPHLLSSSSTFGTWRHTHHIIRPQKTSQTDVEHILYIYMTENHIAIKQWHLLNTLLCIPSIFFFSFYNYILCDAQHFFFRFTQFTMNYSNKHHMWGCPSIIFTFSRCSVVVIFTYSNIYIYVQLRS